MYWSFELWGRCLEELVSAGLDAACCSCIASALYRKDQTKV